MTAPIGAVLPDEQHEAPLTPESPRIARPRSARRRVVVGAVVVVLAAVGGVAALSGAGESAKGETATTPPTGRARVTTRDLVTTDSYEGEIGFGEARSVTSGRAGVVTTTPEEGTTVQIGSVLFEVDLEPSVLLAGSVPAFRALSTESESGADVQQLEQGLVAAGFGDGVTVDEDFTTATATAVESWEEALGRLDPDGVVERGDVVFSPTPLRVAAIAAPVGTQVQVGATVVEATPTTKVISAEVGVDDAARLEAGVAVQLELPDGTATTGKIANIGAPEVESSDVQVAGPGGGGATSTVTVTIAFDDPRVVAGFDSGGVDVTIERSRVDDVLAVPVTALLALAEGGYAVQVVDEGADTGYRLVGVEVGSYADEFVEVSADGIDEGTAVVVP